MATFVLVHGGGHGGWCYKKVAGLLQAEGHEVYAPSLTGLGERSHLLSDRIDLAMHVADVAALFHYQDLSDVILVGHSYGGMVITGAADAAPDRVGRLVYLDAANPVNGQSLLDIAGPMIESTRLTGTPRIGTTVFVDLAAEPDAWYQLAASFGTVPGIDLGSRNIPLNPDGLLALTVGNRLPTVFHNLSGYLSARGEARAWLTIPNASGLVGQSFYMAFVTLDAAQPYGINTISTATLVKVES